MSYKIQDLPSKNRGGKCKQLKYIMLHHTAGKSFKSDVATLRSPAREASANFVVGKAGEIARLVPVGTVAWHAGKGSYAGVPKDDMNSYSVGIEISNLGDGKDEYPEAQLSALDWLISDIDKVIGKALPIIDHKAYAPKRKIDMSANFPLDNYKKFRKHKKTVVKVQKYYIHSLHTKVTTAENLAAQLKRDSKASVSAKCGVIKTSHTSGLQDMLKSGKSANQEFGSGTTSCVLLSHVSRDYSDEIVLPFCKKKGIPEARVQVGQRPAMKYYDFAHGDTARAYVLALADVRDGKCKAEQAFPL